MDARRGALLAALDVAADERGDREVLLGELVALRWIGFVALAYRSQGADVFIPAGTPPTGTTSFQLLSRGNGPPRTLNVPSWESTSDGIPSSGATSRSRT